jgi:hypothetical protein
MERTQEDSAEKTPLTKQAGNINTGHLKVNFFKRQLEWQDKRDKNIEAQSKVMREIIENMGLEEKKFTG